MDLPSINGAVFEKMVSLRRDLHAHPELSWKETRTWKRIAELLAGQGVAGGEPGPSIRGDRGTF